MDVAQHPHPAEGLVNNGPTVGELNELAVTCDASDLPDLGRQIALKIENSTNVTGSERRYVVRVLRMLGTVEPRVLPDTITSLGALVTDLDALQPLGVQPYQALRHTLGDVEVLALDPERLDTLELPKTHIRYRDQVAARLRSAYQADPAHAEHVGAAGTRLPINPEIADSLTALRHASLLGPWEDSCQPRQHIYNALRECHPDSATPRAEAAQTLAEAQPDILAKVLTLDLVKDDRQLFELYDQLQNYHALIDDMKQPAEQGDSSTTPRHSYTKIRDSIAALYEAITFGKDFANLPTQQRYDDSPLTLAYKQAQATLTLAADWLLLHDRLENRL